MPSRQCSAPSQAWTRARSAHSTSFELNKETGGCFWYSTALLQAAFNKRYSMGVKKRKNMCGMRFKKG